MARECDESSDRQGTEAATSLSTGTVSILSKADRLRDRAARLRSEAVNCVSIAVRERDQDHAARLIDEAITLTRRSSELLAKK
ncbi:hypothetical protein QE361_002146 [Sphingomonas sp. SORGH_AS802]|jgi:hypothetical protein|uniref:hypothetical protein n=1 Tax=unclassified Sphingomonas TaxID=196159 RepID=UPI002857BF43|nr:MULTISPECIES: hypothetical protein [unclassified Sphingomonas]MDR6128649.1 hypothetical protein [Sphingomonas sp. SORGH_AS_0438]MDR6135156.1 hypothetical protein [Sphingomonas sp. SORGH_AS_0802]